MALLLVQCSSVVLENVTVMESYGYGLLGYNIMMAELNYCLFHSCKNLPFTQDTINVEVQHCMCNADSTGMSRHNG